MNKDEALQVIRSNYPTGRNHLCEALETLIPELKKSDDEKIRKTLKSFFDSEISDYGNVEWRNGIRYGEIVAWLEKQGEQKPDTKCLLSWSETDEKMLQSLEGIVKDYWAKAEQEKNEIKIREASNVSYFLKTIQKSPLCWIKCSDGLPNRDGTYLVVTDGRHNDVYDMARYDSIEGWHKASEIIYWMPIPQLNNKSIIEQKPTDKVEQKFKVGDFIINEYGFIMQIDGIDGNMYVYHVLDDNRILKHDITKTDKSCHLWTIQDAKDGDVLYHKSPLTGIDYIVMSRGVNGYGNVDSYFRYNSVDGFAINVPSVFDTKKGDITPATKEQRDFLFKKMKEAGYEWDAEKKELKKIEQKSAWSEEDESRISNLCHFLEEDGSQYYGQLALQCTISWLKSLKERIKTNDTTRIRKLFI